MIIHESNINQTGIPLPPMFDSCSFQSLSHVPGSMMVQPQRKQEEAARKKKKENSVWKMLQCRKGEGVSIYFQSFSKYTLLFKRGRDSIKAWEVFCSIDLQIPTLVHKNRCFLDIHFLNYLSYSYTDTSSYGLHPISKHHNPPYRGCAECPISIPYFFRLLTHSMGNRRLTAI